MSGQLRKYAYLSIAASVVTMALKFGAFFLTGSVGLFSDAVESVVNLAAGCIALMAIVVAHKPADSNHAYGHGKVEYFSSGMEGVLIIVAACGIAYTSWQRFFTPVPLNDLGLGIVVAVLAGGVNFITARVMLKAAKEYDNIVLEADARHLLTDVWTSAGLVVALAVIVFGPRSWQILDPILGMLMSLNIIWTGLQLMRRSAHGLMDRGLPEGEVREIVSVVREHAGESNHFHALRTRKAGTTRFVDFHLLVPGQMTVQQSHDLCCRIETALETALPGIQTTIHVEPREDEVSWDCDHVGGSCDGEDSDA